MTVLQALASVPALSAPAPVLVLVLALALVPAPVPRQCAFVLCWGVFVIC